MELKKTHQVYGFIMSHPHSYHLISNNCLRTIVLPHWLLLKNCSNGAGYRQHLKHVWGYSKQTLSNTWKHMLIIFGTDLLDAFFELYHKPFSISDLCMICNPSQCIEDGFLLFFFHFFNLIFHDPAQSLLFSLTKKNSATKYKLRTWAIRHYTCNHTLMHVRECSIRAERKKNLWNDFDDNIKWKFKTFRYKMCVERVWQKSVACNLIKCTINYICLWWWWQKRL